MARQGKSTILLITRHSLLRADFSSANAVTGLWTQQRPDGQEWPILVEVALGLGPKPGKTVYIFSSDLWTQTLSLPHGSANMAPVELAAALNFEAESLSGHSAFESVVGYRALPPGRGYWIVQARAADLAQADETVRNAGSSLGGLGHPGGLPRGLKKTQVPSPWTRIEFWPDAVFLLHGDVQGAAHVQVLNTDAQMGRWRPEWDAWRREWNAAGTPEAVAGPGIALPPVGEADALALDDVETLPAWLTAWAESLKGSKAAVPLLRRERQPMTAERRRALSFGLAAITIALCWAIHFFLGRVLLETNQATKQAQAPALLLTELQKQLPALQGKQKELQTQGENLERALRVLGTHRRRLAQLMTCLGAQRSEHLFVDKIDEDHGEPRLRGHCLEPELADQFASKLSQCLLAQGWEVQASKKQAEKFVANGSPWSFDILFNSATDMTLDIRLDTKKAKAK